MAGLDTVTIDGIPSEDLYDFIDAEHKFKSTHARPGRYFGATYDVEGVGVFRLYQAANGTSSVRYQVNLQGAELAAAPTVLGSLLTPTGVARVDAKVDYPWDLANTLFDHKRVHREVHMNPQGGLESIGFGKRKCPRYIRVYNKQLKSHLPDPLWRVEAEFKSKPTRTLRDDLFDGLTAYSWPPADGLRWQDRAALQLAYDYPGIQRSFSTPTRARVDRLLSEFLQPLSPSPADAYRAALPKLQLALDRLLGDALPPIRAGPAPGLA